MEDAMNTLEILTLADDLQIAAKQIIKNKQTVNSDRIYEFIDSLELLNQPIRDYFSMKQEDYYEKESDKKLTIQDLNDTLANIQDRILTNHVDGYVQNNDINFTYNHENPYSDGKYSREVDFHVLSYSLKVITAMIPVIGLEGVKNHLSKDALLSVGLAAHNLDK